MSQRIIKEWFLSHRRVLPWRENPTPYRVWISEVMLQQTQVTVVIPYFHRWMSLFPTVKKLEKASLETVLKVWEGLGYYSRARHLHEAAHYISAHYNGELPSDPEKLATIKGLGPYTQAAIRCFAFRQKVAAVDGNVLRLLSRLYAIEEPIDCLSTYKHITALAEALLPDEEPWLVSEGLIELGATVCKKNPNCGSCPLQANCLAFRYQKTRELPKRKERFKTAQLYRHVGVIECENHYLVQKGKKGKIMADLYEFPYLEKREGDVEAQFEEALELELEYQKPLPTQKHCFTNYRAHLFPHVLRAKILDKRYMWKEKQALAELPFSSGHRRIVNTFLA